MFLLLLFEVDWFGFVVVCECLCECCVEGLMFKYCELVYGIGCIGNVWWKWKIVLFSVDVVFVYV